MNEHAAASVLHALEPDEELAVRAHLPDCPSCRGAVRDAEIIARALAESVQQVDPPDQLRGTLLSHAARGSTERRSRLTRPQDQTRATVAVSHTGPGRRRSRRVARPILAFAAAAVMVIAGLAGYTGDLYRQRDTQLAHVRALTLMIDRLGTPGTRYSTLLAPDGRPVAVVIDATAEQALLTTGLSRNDTTRSIYVVWGVGAAAPQPIDAFDVADTGPVLHDLPPTPTRPFLGYAISLEPGRRPPTEPTHVVATGRVSP